MTKPMIFLSSSQTSATTPRQPSNSRNPSSVHWAPPGAPLRISVPAAASASRNARILAATGSPFGSATMRRVPLPEDLRIRPPHVIRIQRQRVRSSPFGQGRHSQPPDHWRAHTRNALYFFKAPLSRFPQLIRNNAFPIHPNPPHFLPLPPFR